MPFLRLAKVTIECVGLKNKHKDTYWNVGYNNMDLEKNRVLSLKIGKH